MEYSSPEKNEVWDKVRKKCSRLDGNECASFRAMLAQAHKSRVWQSDRRRDMHRGCTPLKKNLAWQHGTSATFNQRSFRRYARRTTIEDHTVATWQVPAVTNLAVAFTSDLVYVVTVRYPFDAHCCPMGTAIKHPVPDRVKPSFVIFDIRALWGSALSVRVPGCQKLQMTASPGQAQDVL